MAGSGASRARPGGGRRAPPPVLRLPRHLDRTYIEGLRDHLRTLMESSHAGVVICDAGDLASPCLAAVEVLAGLQLTAKEAGRSICLRRPSAELLELLDLAGLSDVVLPEEDHRGVRGAE